MNEQEILNILKSLNYASLYVRTNGQHSKFGPGESAWQHDLQQANEQQRDAVVTKLERWQQRRSA